MSRIDYRQSEQTRFATILNGLVAVRQHPVVVLGVPEQIWRTR